MADIIQLTSKSGYRPVRFKNFKTYIFRMLEPLTRAARWIRSIDKHYIRIEEINTTTREIIIHSPGMRTILKLHINEAMSDPNILCRLIPVQACWLGYYSSLTPEESKKFLADKSGLLLRFKSGRYRVVSLDRKGDITYLDTRTNVSQTQSPIFIAQDETLIAAFDPSQACYIGILAGIDRVRRKPAILTNQNRPILRLVQ